VIAKTKCQNQRQKKEKRPGFRFSLKLSLVAITSSCVVLAWFGADLRQSQMEAEFVKQIGSLNKDVPDENDPHFLHLYDYESGGRGAPRVTTGEPKGPSWLRKLFGKNLFSRITRLSIKGDLGNSKPLSFAKLKELEIRKVKKLERIELINVPELEDLSIIENLRQLEDIRVTQFESNLKDASAISNLKRTKFINLSVSPQFSFQANWDALASQNLLLGLQLSFLKQPVQAAKKRFPRRSSRREKESDPEYVLARKSTFETDVTAAIGCFIPAPNIEILSFRDVDPGLTDLSCFSVMPKLRILEITGSPTLTSLRGLEQCQKLEELKIVMCPNLDDIQALGKLENLNSVSIKFSNHEMTIPDLASSNLQTLELVGLKGSMNLEFLKSASNLEHLNVTGCDLESFGGLRYLARLKEIKLCNGEKIKSELTTYLDLSCSNSLKDLDGLEVFPQLQHVNASGCVQFENIDGLVVIEHLSSFNRTGCIKVKELDVKRLRKKYHPLLHDLK
jgi:hypothetical protein